jgi:hypothetical protein
MLNKKTVKTKQSQSALTLGHLNSIDQSMGSQSFADCNEFSGISTAHGLRSHVSMSHSMIWKLRLVSLALVSSVSLLGPSANAGNAGVGGSGGDNTINGRSIETFARYPDADCQAYPDKCLPDFRETILPLISRIKKLDSDKGSELEERYKAMSWIVVPEKLDHLPESVIGLPFPTEQSAVQNHNRIFINQDGLSGPSETREALYVHELAESLLDDDEKNTPEGLTRTQNLAIALLKPRVTLEELQKVWIGPSEKAKLLAECAPYVNGTTAIDRAKKAEHAKNAYYNMESTQVLTAGSTAVAAAWGGIFAAETVGISMIPGAVGAVATGIEHLAFRRPMKSYKMTQSCLLSLYPNEFPPRAAVTERATKTGISGTGSGSGQADHNPSNYSSSLQ